MGDINLKTITFDPAKYKLVPVDQSSQQQEVGIEAIYLDMTAMNKQFTANRVYRHMVAVVPDQLQGVVEHSGEPSATVIKKGSDRQWMSERLGHLPDGIYSLYTHPAPSQPSAEAIVAKALESAIDAVETVNASCDAQVSALEQACDAIRAANHRGGKQVSNTEETYYELAEFLHSIGWRSPCDAQWENLRDSLAKIRLLLSVERSLNDQIEIDTLLHGLRLNQRRIEELEMKKDLLLNAAILAEKTIDILWVSHHANRCDAALETLEEAIKAAENT